MSVHDRLRYREAQAGAIGAAGDHRYKNRVLKFLGDPGTVVDDIYPQYQPVTNRAYSELALRASAQGNFTLGRTLRRLQRITAYVQHGLNQLSLITRDFGQTGVVVSGEANLSV